MLFSQPSIPSTPTGTNLNGQTIIVTGANTGLGYESSLQFLRLGASNLILGVRNIEKGKIAREKLLSDDQVQKSNPNAIIKVFQLDLADYQSVRSFANEVEAKVERLDVLLLNAGINLAHWETSSAGHEMLIQVNYLSNALLALLLLPLLQKSSPPDPSKLSDKSSFEPPFLPTITWVSSMGQAFTSLNAKSYRSISQPTSILAHYADPTFYSRFTRYPDSKFFVSLFVRALAAHITLDSTQGSSSDTSGSQTKAVVINSVCPGTVDTTADDNLPFYLRIPMNLNRRLRARTVEEGARTLVFAARVVGAASHGRYLSGNAVAPLAEFADMVEGREFEGRLWKETIEELERVDGRVVNGLKS